MGDNPDIPMFTELAIAAAAVKETFDSFIQAGFTEDQAIKIIVGMFRPDSE